MTARVILVLACISTLFFSSSCVTGRRTLRTQDAPTGRSLAHLEPTPAAEHPFAPGATAAYQDQVEAETPAAAEPTYEEAQPAAEIKPHPLKDYSQAELEALLLSDPEALGAASLGRASAGALYGASPMPASELWTIVNPRETWGTAETVGYLTHTITRVNELFPDSPPLNIGDISDRDGGHLRPHVSHQSGRDVDLGFYYTTDAKWYSHANSRNLDLARTWAFVKLTVTETDVHMIFVDRSIQALLREYALEIGEDEAWLDQVFGGPLSNLRPLVLHEDGHKTHLHVRYYNPIAEETGRRIYSSLIKHKVLSPPTYYVKYKVRRGDTLQKIAAKFKTSVASLKKANRLRSTRIFANRTYKIPRRGGVARVSTPVVVPSRRLPPPSSYAGRPVSVIQTLR